MLDFQQKRGCNKGRKPTRINYSSGCTAGNDYNHTFKSSSIDFVTESYDLLKICRNIKHVTIYMLIPTGYIFPDFHCTVDCAQLNRPTQLFTDPLTKLL